MEPIKITPQRAEKLINNEKGEKAERIKSSTTSRKGNYG